MIDKELLTSIGFSNEFIVSLENFEAKVPVVQKIEEYAFEDISLSTTDISGNEVILENTSADYTSDKVTIK